MPGVMNSRTVRIVLVMIPDSDRPVAARSVARKAVREKPVNSANFARSTFRVVFSSSKTVLEASLDDWNSFPGLGTFADWISFPGLGTTALFRRGSLLLLGVRFASRC